MLQHGLFRCMKGVQFGLCSRTVACREVKGTFTVKYDDVKAVELSLPTQAIDGVWVSIVGRYPSRMGGYRQDHAPSSQGVACFGQ